MVTLEEMQSLKPGDRISFHGKEGTVVLCADTPSKADNDDHVYVYVNYDNDGDYDYFRKTEVMSYYEAIEILYAYRTSTKPRDPSAKYCSCSSPSKKEVSCGISGASDIFHICTTCKLEI
jgi:hypothetical protein